jgi:SAM-dependent methyltransferase
MSDDGFGEMLRTCWQRGPGRGLALQVIERDDGYVSVEDAYRYFTRPEEWIDYERRAVELARGRVLDVGCAAGRHMLALADSCEVIGIDPSPGAVAIARAQGLDARLGTAQDPGTGLGVFDSVMLLGGNLGLLGSRDQAPKVLASLAHLTTPGGRLYAIGHDPYAISSDHENYHQANRTAGRLPGQVRMRLRYRAWSSPWFDRLLMSADELARLIVTNEDWAVDSCSEPDDVGFFLAVLRRKPGVAPAAHARRDA